MEEYLTSVSMFLITLLLCVYLCKEYFPRKKTQERLGKFANKWTNKIVSTLLFLTTSVVPPTIILRIMGATFDCFLPFLDLLTTSVIRCERCVSKHYAAHRKCRRKRRLTRRDVLTLMAMASTSNTQNGLRKTPIPCQFDSDSFIIGLDSYSSRCLSNKKSHFTNLKPTPSNFGSLKGIGGNTTIEGIGTLSWDIEDDFGVARRLIIPNSLYVPLVPKCLLSPQHLAQVSYGDQRHTTYLEMRHDRGILHWGPKGQFKKTGMISKLSNTPDIYSAPVCSSFNKYSTLTSKQCHMCETVCYPAHIIPDDESSVSSAETSTSIEDSPVIITPENEETPSDTNNSSTPFSDHQDENITEFMTIDEPQQVNVIEPDEEELTASTPYAELLRWHYRLGHMSFHKLKAMARLGILPRQLMNVENPKCASCYFGKMTKRPWRTKAQPKRILPTTRPGQCVSVDQMESSTTGFVAQLKGRLTTRRYRVATIFVDHYSDLSYVHLQSSTKSDETVEAKLAFEAFARDHGVNVQHYHADNGRFADNLFMKSIQDSNQTITFCSVNAHHQNGRAEKRIRDLREAGRTQLLHAISRWPQAVNTHLWPYAVRTANDIRNRTVDKKDGTSPLERFSSITVASNMKHFHTFGCPVYALDKGLASNKKIKPWLPRSCLGINLGPSPRHARSCALVLDPNTGLVSPTFHVSFDEFFETTRSSAANPSVSSRWIQLAGFQDAPTSSTTSQTSEGASITDETTVSPLLDLFPQSQRENAGDTSELFIDSNVDSMTTENTSVSQLNQNEVDPDQINADATNTANESTNLRRSSRLRTPIDRLTYDAFITSLDDPSSYYDALHQDDYKLQDEMTEPISFLAKTDEDTMYYHQAMASPDKKEFLKAMVKEYNDHAKRGHWELVHKKDVPQDTRILDSVWSMKRKRDILTRKITKWKARLNVHGGQQEHGINYFETYSPVVNWFSVRLLYIMALLNQWHTRQIDFILAYPQADIEVEMFMQLPKGLKVEGAHRDTHALRLKKNLYGQKQAGRVWNRHLTKGLEKIGFHQSRVDECVYYRDNVIFCFFVDDGIFYSPDNSAIDLAIADLLNEKKAGARFDIENRGDVSDYITQQFLLIVRSNLIGSTKLLLMEITI